MKLRIIERIRDEYDDGCEEVYAVEVDLGGDRVSFHNMDGCPEDATLNRDLNDVYNIETLIMKAFEAGKNGEDIVIERIQERD